MKMTIRSLALFLATASPLTSYGQIAGPDPLFQSNEPLNITFEAPFAQIDRERDKETEYEGVLRYTEPDGTEVTLDIGLEVRGNWRLRKDNCRYSQLWVDLKRGQVENTLFAEQNRLKLVVQCRAQDRYRNYLAKEQQIYTAFGSLSELHFDTRLVNATYVDSDDPESSRTHLAFFIEHQRRLRQRFNMKEVELSTIPYQSLDPLQSSLVGLFMYQVGNTDFSMTSAVEGEECCHNSKLLEDENGTYYPIPYDFDASGFVDANYAAPPGPNIGLRNNRSRQYRGFCVEQESINAALARISAERENAAAIFSDTSFVSERTATQSMRYLERFYEVIDSERLFRRQILNECRGDGIQ